MKKNSILKLFLVLFLILSFQQFLFNIALNSGNSKTYLQSSDPIVALSNSAIASISHSGSGTATTPYIIENLDFSFLGWAIKLENIDVYVTIRNCNFVDCSGGIYMKNCERISILGNTFDDLYFGIECYITNNLVISGNTFYDCKEYGIKFTVDNNYHLVENNKFYSCGIDIIGGFGYNNLFTNNFVNDKQLMVIMSQTGTIIEDRTDIGEIIFFDCQNCSIINVEIENSAPAIVIHSSDYTKITNSKISSSSNGIRIYASDNIEIEKCDFRDNDITALKINYCHNAIISQNFFLNNGFGINAAQVWNYSIKNNTILDNSHYGLTLAAGYEGNKLISNFIGYCRFGCIKISMGGGTEVINNTLINTKEKLIIIDDITNTIFSGNINYTIDSDIFLTPSNTFNSTEISLLLEWNFSIFVSEYVIYINGVEEARCSSTTNSTILELKGEGFYDISIKTISSLYSIEYDDFDPIRIILDYRIIEDTPVEDTSDDSTLVEDTLEEDSWSYFTSFDNTFMVLSLLVLVISIKSKRK